ncbi:hypothetical protein H2198_001685 [Neophaeococcomyces mojaviensis]|uniref:Uncharacterized protein n=1 Tax=Neophaeococcomyces mojaviensis TaxID=3383035 RepID=A0ACC3AGD6_9EURO|nr:hypothetical protein H2198_001685 [Knufia sp. JES_112]
MALRPSYAAISQRAPPDQKDAVITAKHASFEHERLKLSERSIRLFQLQHGKNGLVSLRMTQFSADRRPPYKAISYTWGSNLNPKSILVNGKVFPLHVNLWQLLYHLRLKGENSFLWADALCINQFNLRERNFHVQLMGRIYEKAESVIVWLGLPSKDRTEINAINFVEEIGRYRKAHGDTMFTNLYLRPQHQHRWETLLRMCQHPYWQRTWIIQEFLFAPGVELLCGARSMQWKEYENLIDLLRRDPVFETHPTITSILRSRTTRLTLRRRAGSQSTLRELLQEYCDSTCTERHDKIYGILGLATDCAEDPETGIAQGITPDYEKDYVEVFLDALSCIKQSLPSEEVLPAAALLILQALHIKHSELAEYILQREKNVLSIQLSEYSLAIVPEYVSPVLKVWPAWTSTRDLQQKLEAYDWGQHIGYEVQRVLSNQQLTPQMPRIRRLSSTRTVHSTLADDFVSNVLEAANPCFDLSYLHNYPCEQDLVVPLEHIVQHPTDKLLHDNSLFSKPSLILEQNARSETLRLGFACTNVQRGDLILQFRGLDMTLIVRPIGHELKLVGKAMMVVNSNVHYEHAIDPICDTSIWASHCWCGHNPESLRLRSDPLSLAELLLKPS